MYPAWKRALAVVAVLAVAVAVPAAGNADSEPTAEAAASCKPINTRNGGRAEFIETQKVRCRTARRVAKRANGRRRFSALGFQCSGNRTTSGEYRRLYGCGRVVNGKAQGVGFFWKKR